jgi:hypothetical protein
MLSRWKDVIVDWWLLFVVVFNILKDQLEVKKNRIHSELHINLNPQQHLDNYLTVTQHETKLLALYPRAPYSSRRPHRRHHLGCGFYLIGQHKTPKPVCRPKQLITNTRKGLISFTKL